MTDVFEVECPHCGLLHKLRVRLSGVRFSVENLSLPDSRLNRVDNEFKVRDLTKEIK